MTMLPAAGARRIIWHEEESMSTDRREFLR
jgi:hypothetical protein